MKGNYGIFVVERKIVNRQFAIAALASIICKGFPLSRAGTQLLRDAYIFSCHSRECGNLDVEHCQAWMPACAGTTRHGQCVLFPCHYRVMSRPVRGNDTI